MSIRELALVLRGEGIECEVETKRWLEVSGHFKKVEYLECFSALNSAELKKKLSPGTWIFLPGGFSFSDHFGSGRLLARELHTAGFFETLLTQESHLFGICNGFQILVRAGIFGPSVRLVSNMKSGYVNRWAKISMDLGGDDKEFETFLSVRHGEGRLQFEKLADSVKPFCFYADAEFNNGSQEQIAGLVLQKKKSTVWGMMPHPEIALRAADRPDYRGPEYIEESRKRSWDLQGDGLKILESVLAFTERKDA